MVLKAFDPRLGPVRRLPLDGLMGCPVANPIAKTDELGKSYEEYSKRYWEGVKKRQDAYRAAAVAEAAQFYNVKCRS